MTDDDPSGKRRMHAMSSVLAVRRATSRQACARAAVLAAGLLALAGWLGWDAYRSGAL